jgi:hypothetical protein
MNRINFATLVEEETLYPVTYTVRQNGDRIKENTTLRGGDLTENQIKELYYKGYFEQKPTQEEVDGYLDYLITHKRFTTFKK